MAGSKTKVKAKGNTSNAVRSTRLYKSRARSRITNGASILPNVDGRTFWVRRYRDLNSLLLSDQGGDENASESVKMIVRRAACLAVELERREMLYAETGAATDAQIETFQRGANTLRRLLQAIGLERRPRDVTPTLQEYIAANYGGEPEEQEAQDSVEQESAS